MSATAAARRLSQSSGSARGARHRSGLKLTELFGGDDGRALRVSRYLAPPDREPHVRFSVWSPEGEAEAVVSVAEAEAARLAGFLADIPAPRRRRRLRGALGTIGRSR